MGIIIAFIARVVWGFGSRLYFYDRVGISSIFGGYFGSGCFSLRIEYSGGES